MWVLVPKPLKGFLNTAFSILISISCISGFFFLPWRKIFQSPKGRGIRTNERISKFLLCWEFFRLVLEQSGIPTYGSAFQAAEGESLKVFRNLVLVISAFTVLALHSSLSSYWDCKCWAQSYWFQPKLACRLIKSKRTSRGFYLYDLFFKKEI